MQNRRRRRLHGGKTTGPRTAASLEKSRRALEARRVLARGGSWQALARTNRDRIRGLIARGKELGYGDEELEDLGE
jgi:hypothetical protein